MEGTIFKHNVYYMNWAHLSYNLHYLFHTWMRNLFELQYVHLSCMHLWIVVLLVLALKQWKSIFWSWSWTITESWPLVKYRYFCYSKVTIVEAKKQQEEEYAKTKTNTCTQTKIWCYICVFFPWIFLLTVILFNEYQHVYFKAVHMVCIWVLVDALIYAYLCYCPYCKDKKQE